MALKLRIMAETQEQSAQVRAVAFRHGVSESLVFTWRRQVQQGALVPAEAPVFLPMQAFEASSMSVARSQPRPELPGYSLQHPAVSLPRRPQASIIGIELGGGRQVQGGQRHEPGRPGARAGGPAGVILSPRACRFG